MGDEIEDLEGSTGFKASTPISFALDVEKEGDVRVAFAKLDGKTIDRDGHVSDPGSIPTKRVPISAFGHGSWPAKGNRPPTGAGEIGEDQGEAKLAGSFFVDTTHGRDAYLTTKGLGELAQWSYGYKIRKAERAKVDGKAVVRLKALDVFEVSPVLMGAGTETRTLAIKSDETGPLAGLPFGDDFERVLLDVDAIVARSKSLRELRAKEGRELSDANRARLVRLRDSIEALAETRAEVDELLARTERADPDAEKAALRLLAQFEATESRLLGVTIGVG